MKEYRHLIGWAFLVISGLLVAGLTLPDHWRAEARVVIASRPQEVFPMLSGLKRGMEWAVWFEHDPQMKVTWSEPDQGVGASYQWSGNASVGNGEIRITGVEPDRQLDLVISMDEGGFQSQGRIRLNPDPGGTAVVWIQEGVFGFDLFARLQRPLLEKSVAAPLQASLDRLRRSTEATRTTESASP
jgi:uncharacterized protein YndB with AHSA1/START domain